MVVWDRETLRAVAAADSEARVASRSEARCSLLVGVRGVAGVTPLADEQQTDGQLELQRVALAHPRLRLHPLLRRLVLRAPLRLPLRLERGGPRRVVA